MILSDFETPLYPLKMYVKMSRKLIEMKRALPGFKGKCLSTGRECMQCPLVIKICPYTEKPEKYWKIFIILADNMRSVEIGNRMFNF